MAEAGKINTTILLVEDNPGDQKLFSKSLQMKEIDSQVVTADTGEEAVEYFKAANEDKNFIRPDLIILDLNMPGMGGKAFLKHFKNMEEFNDIPVVVLTTSDSDIDIVESYKLQAAGYIKKPVSLKGFLEVISTLEKYWIGTCKLPGRDS
ncbi:response regulator [Sedimentisphaera salicampi]|uniref:Response regulator rcp1 n=1 Tax=Sedimentisphaera salicampi TaxID=1941349 RepID=A0A1W6LK24_9BACT|nr:response regulator [Sedimentisphaera salicampi]ARN56127.1 Response regulator rcp1 [Sedimentisphaera salicampi]OXU15696.1 Response regulator rcp1 [Sedimentisphaera salicampi]